MEVDRSKKCQVIANAITLMKIIKSCGAECSQNISATISILSRICDYFRKPVYRRSADV